MSELQWFSRSDRVLPAVIELPPCAAENAGWSAHPTQRALWVANGERVARVGHPGPWTVLVVPDGLLAWSEAQVVVRLGASVVVDVDPLRRLGSELCLVRELTGPWRLESGPELPVGARWSDATRCVGDSVIWADSEYVYRWDGLKPPVPLFRAQSFHVDPHGSVWPGDAAVVEVPELSLPQDAVLKAAKVAGQRVVATRVEDGRVRGWLRDGTVVLAQLSSAYS